MRAHEWLGTCARGRWPVGPPGDCLSAAQSAASPTGGGRFRLDRGVTARREYDPRHDPMGPALTRPSRYISRQASCRLAPSDETVRDTYRLHGAPARSVPSRGPIGGLGGYVVTVRLCGGSPGPQRCGTNQYIGADHATKQGHEGRRSVAPVGPIRLQLALEVVYEGRSRLPNGGQVRTCG